MKYISYLRVSTKKQGRSGLGIEAQRTIIAAHVEANGGEIVAEYIDIESGKSRKRANLDAATKHCRAESATLIVAKLDRLARDVEFTFSIVNSGIAICFCDMPEVNTLILGIFATVAQYERELTSNRVIAALEAKRARGAKLGAPNATFTDEQRKQAAQKRVDNAAHKSLQYIDLITMYRERGMTLQQIADNLNIKGFNTPRGGKFYPSTVKMYLNRANNE